MNRNNYESRKQLATIFGELQLRTKQPFGDDLVKWFTWWEEARLEYQAPELNVDLNEAARLMEEMRAIQTAK